MPPSPRSLDEDSHNWREWIALVAYALVTAVAVSVLLVSVVLVFSTPASHDLPASAPLRLLNN